MIFALGSVVPFVCGLPVLAAEADRPGRIHFLAGVGELGGSYVEGEESWAFLVSFEQKLAKYLSAEFSYFNEGHPDPKGHRDGFGLQLFGNYRPFASGSETSFLERLRLRAGAGPTIYFNTVNPTGEQPREETGVGVKITGAIDVEIAGGFSVGPRVEDHLGIDSQNAVVAGLDFSYELFPAPERVRPDYGVVAAGGKSVRNARGGSGVAAYGEVHKNSLLGSDNLGVSAAFLSIGGPNERRGVAPAVEVKQQFFDGGELELGAGVGPYFYWDGESSGQRSSGVTALIETTASYRIWNEWKLMASFMREAGSTDQENYDVFLGGIGIDFDLPGHAPPSDEANR